MFAAISLKTVMFILRKFPKQLPNKCEVIPVQRFLFFFHVLGKTSLHGMLKWMFFCSVMLK